MGKPEADCQALLAHLYEFLDGEVGEDECAALERHVEACPECFNQVDFERGVKELVRRKCSERLPEGLTARLRERIQDG